MAINAPPRVAKVLRQVIIGPYPRSAAMQSVLRRANAVTYCPDCAAIHAQNPCHCGAEADRGISRQVAAVGFHTEMVRHCKPGIRTTADDTQNSGHRNLLTRCIQTHHRPPPALGHHVAGRRVFGPEPTTEGVCPKAVSPSHIGGLDRVLRPATTRALRADHRFPGTINSSPTMGRTSSVGSPPVTHAQIASDVGYSSSSMM